MIFSNGHVYLGREKETYEERQGVYVVHTHVYTKQPMGPWSPREYHEV